MAADGPEASAGSSDPPPRPAPPNGFIILDKPPGPSSRRALDRVRRLAQTRQAGYAGTLDPLATGVLVCALGSATRLLAYMEHDDKRYLATVELGRETDTDDAEGREVAHGDWRGVAVGTVAQALDAFRGVIRQRPPSYAAISIGGQRLYALARRGSAVEAPERTVTIHRLELVDWAPPRLTLDIHCSKGTYVRALARDLGRALGCRAHLCALRRTRSGAYSIEQAVTLAELERAVDAGGIAPYLLPPLAGVAALPTRALTPEAARRVVQGQRVPLDAPDGLVALIGPSGGLVAVGRVAAGEVQPERVLVGASSLPDDRAGGRFSTHRGEVT